MPHYLYFAIILHYTGRLSAPGVISCKPPRLAESGEYEITVSLDGENKRNKSEVLTEETMQ